MIAQGPSFWNCFAVLFLFAGEPNSDPVQLFRHMGMKILVVRPASRGCAGISVNAAGESCRAFLLVFIGFKYY
jgi:hypothetical protein